MADYLFTAERRTETRICIIKHQGNCIWFSLMLDVINWHTYSDQ